MPDQFIDRTYNRISTFFGDGIVGHVAFGDPVCATVAKAAAQACAEVGVVGKLGGTYVCMEGPQFSTRAESNLYRSWGADVIGMTNLQEAKLAREAEICYVTVAMVTDYDCWHPDHDHVTVDQVIKVLGDNADKARRLVMRAAPKLGPVRKPSPLGIEHVLDTAIITAPEKRDRALFAKLDAVAGRVLKTT
jgi:5'-methylthioadenosine phosphorylase